MLKPAGRHKDLEEFARCIFPLLSIGWILFSVPTHPHETFNIVDNVDRKVCCRQETARESWWP